MPAATAALQLTRIGSTALYFPSNGATFVFLLWDMPQQPEQSIPLEQTWADQGTPPFVGYYVFLLAVPAGEQAVELETKLRDALTKPVVTGFAWVAFTPGQALDMRGTCMIALDDAQQPVVAADAPLKLPANMLEFGFGAQLPVFSVRDSEGMSGLALTRPRPDASAAAPGIDIPFVGATAGCIAFSGFLKSSISGDESIKPLAKVLIDPLRPFNSQRTRVTPVGLDYVLSVDREGNYHLSPDTSSAKGQHRVDRA